jgi:hypothetical protein
MSKAADQKKSTPGEKCYEARAQSGNKSGSFRNNDVCFSHVVNHRITLLHGLVVLLLVLAG